MKQCFMASLSDILHTIYANMWHISQHDCSSYFSLFEIANFGYHTPECGVHNLAKNKEPQSLWFSRDMDIMVVII